MGHPLCLAALLLLSTTAAASAALTPSEMQAKMGLGINLGNRIDLYEQPVRPVNESFFEAYASKGFTNCRIPVYWGEHTGTSAPYTIDADFLDAVEQYVDWSLERKMVTIINTHHEKWLDSPSVFASKLPRLEAIWTQIAERFKDKDETLLFEIFNEAHLMTADQLNTMNAAILPIIRKQNPTRVVLLQGLKFSNPTWFIQNPDALVVPADSQLMIEIHNYDPFKYAGANPSVFSWGSDADRAKLTDWVDKFDEWAKNRSLPVYYGEFGVTNEQTSNTGRDEWFKAHAAAIRSKGWAASVWNDGGGHLIYDYASGKWDDAVLADLNVATYQSQPPH